MASSTTIAKSSLNLIKLIERRTRLLPRSDRGQYRNAAIVARYQAIGMPKNLPGFYQRSPERPNCAGSAAEVINNDYMTGI